MPRGARKQSSTAIYHVIMRGINKQTIFEEEEDKRRFLEILKKYNEISKFELYSYCLMDNHIHILLKAQYEELSVTMKRSVQVMSFGIIGVMEELAIYFKNDLKVKM